MQVTRQHLVDILRMAALPDLADEAFRRYRTRSSTTTRNAFSPGTAFPKMS